MPEPDLSRLSCLIVDRDPEFGDWAKSVLNDAGIGAVHYCATTPDAIELTREHRPNLVLLDLEFSGFGAIELMRQLRDKTVNPQSDLYVIPMAVAATPDLLRRAVQLGIISFIRKPVDAEALLRRVAVATTRPRRFVFGRRYVGPDRRRSSHAIDFPERRRNVAASTGAMTRPRITGSGEPVIPLAASNGDEATASVSGHAPAAAAPPVSEERRRHPGSDPLPEARPPARQPVAQQADVAEAATLVAETTPADDSARKPGPRPNGRARHPGNGAFSKTIDQHLVWLRSGGKEGARASFAKANLHGIDISGFNLTGADLRETVLSDSNCQSTIFQGADLRWADLAHADIRSGDLAVARLRHTNFRNTRMDGANLRGADLAGADLSGASLKGVDLSGANLLSANFSQADLSDVVGLTQAQFDRALADQVTRLPGGIRLPQGD